jgi:acyl transferase domain-containing protein
VGQVGRPIALADSIAAILDEHRAVFLEIGPDDTMSAQVRRLPSVSEDMCISSASVDEALARLWLGGVNVDWTMFYEGAGCHRTPLPTYPFETQRYWIERPAGHTLRSREVAERAGNAESAEKPKRGDDERFYLPVWKRLPFIPEKRAGLTSRQSLSPVATSSPA